MKLLFGFGFAVVPSLCFAGLASVPVAAESSGNGSSAVIGVLLILGLVAITGGFKAQTSQPDTPTQDDNDEVIMKF